MSEDFAYDVYLSYSQADAAWVRGELLTRLQQAGLNVCLDVNDFVAGAPRAEEFERAITTSKQTLLVLTPAYLNGEWNSFGNLMVQTIDPANQQRRLLPHQRTL